MKNNRKERFIKNKKIKTLFDRVLSCMALLALSPLFVGISIWIKIDTKGPVIFKQKRLGMNGKVFEMYKFRSMVINAEQMEAGLFNYKNDPRVTKAGRFLRSTSLDELPQLINVWKGEMSLVGPRPAVEYELGEFKTLNHWYKRRFIMKPGITGLAQIKGRNENNWDEKISYDNQYINLFKRYGCVLDLKILFETVFKVFGKSNIYEKKIDDALSDEESAKLAQEEIIRKAHEEHYRR